MMIKKPEEGGGGGEGRGGEEEEEEEEDSPAALERASCSWEEFRNYSTFSKVLLMLKSTLAVEAFAA
jgi:hypothetical protein